ncbi:DNA topology modulation protein flar-related protein [Lachnospiraceae bacterium KM106-2]|nr:DNA topology modulation protein flar-related protein [Lachnospiraceae bacterium KM106-2]
MKIAIVGYSGSGKSTLAKFLGDFYGIPILYLDQVQFLPGWQERPTEEGKEIVSKFMESPSWVIDGNYNSFYQKERLEQADQIIFMNFNRVNCLFRALRRYHRNRNKTRESMTNGCIEKMDAPFIWWILREGRTKRRRNHYKDIIRLYPDKSIVIKNQHQLEAYIKKLR